MLKKKEGVLKKKILQAGFEGTFGACLSIWPSGNVEAKIVAF